MTAAQASVLSQWKARLDAAWAEACWWEGIDPGEKFVVFSEGNPGGALHNQVTGEYFAWVKGGRRCGT